MELGALVDMRFAIDPFDFDAFPFEQAFVVGDELGQSLERRGVFKSKYLHATAPFAEKIVLYTIVSDRLYTAPVQALSKDFASGGRAVELEHGRLKRTSLMADVSGTDAFAPGDASALRTRPRPDLVYAPPRDAISGGRLPGGGAGRGADRGR